jgi:hypothetical protein
VRAMLKDHLHRIRRLCICIDCDPLRKVIFYMMEQGDSNSDILMSTIV